MKLYFFPNLVYIDPSYEIKERVISFSIYHRLLKVTQISTSSQNMNDGEYFHPKHRIYLLWPRTEERRMLSTYILINGMKRKALNKHPVPSTFHLELSWAP